jgi:hypothetical protein
MSIINEKDKHNNSDYDNVSHVESHPESTGGAVKP